MHGQVRLEQTPATKEMHEGQNATLTCSISIGSLQWYKQSPGQEPIFLMFVHGSQKKDETKHFISEYDFKERRGYLHIVDAQLDHGANYFCVWMHSEAGGQEISLKAEQHARNHKALFLHGDRHAERWMMMMMYLDSAITVHFTKKNNQLPAFWLTIYFVEGFHGWVAVSFLGCNAMFCMAFSPDILPTDERAFHLLLGLGMLEIELPNYWNHPQGPSSSTSCHAGHYMKTTPQQGFFQYSLIRNIPFSCKFCVQKT
ncbi:uncharacterized protein LOC103280672 [Anolis carolinensis]|uniref:uncharacterized protein LOC103280672 n=1 Tax=Anolis carolinensis TaxID=28377 RepID=UPI002F2B7025